MGKRIVTVGTCQADLLASCIELLSPDAQVDRITNANYSLYGSDQERLLAEVARCDLVITQSFSPGLFGSLTHHDVQAAARHSIVVPTIVFGAFHPDTVYVYRGDGQGIYRSPMGDYHSALVIYGHARGYSVEKTASLFRDDVFEEVGYYEIWFPSQRALLESARELGFDLVPLFTRWMRRGCFMHTVNHPKLSVYSDLAHAVLAKAGMPAQPVDCADYLCDPMLTVIWPVYPPIAARMGHKGNYIFKHSSETHNLINMSIQAKSCFDLNNFIGCSFEMYATHPQIANDCHRVQEWLSSDELFRTLSR